MGSLCASGCERRGNRNRSYNSTDDIVFSTGMFVQENRESFIEIYTLFPDSIGYGSYGQVYLCEHKRSKERRAVKIIIKQNLQISAIEKKQVFNEVDIIKKLDHPNILKVFEYFEDLKFYFIVMEYCPEGDLSEELERVTRFDEKEVSNIMVQLLSGLSCIHSHSIVHRDIKLENILIYNKDKGLHIKIIDFNIATLTSKKKLTKFKGTPHYMAPEVINENYDEKCDIWSSGVIMYTLLTGEFPFKGRNRDEILETILNNRIDINGKILGKVSNQAKNLLTKLLVKNPDQRITAVEALNHEWIASVFKEKFDRPLFQKTLTRMMSVKKKPKLKEMFETFLLGQVQKNDPRIELYERVFYDFDKDKNGVIEKSDILAILKTTMSDDQAEKEADRIIRIFDNDQSGGIDLTEFLRAALEEEIFICKENILKAFCYLDKNRSDLIEKSELMSWLQEGAIIPMNVIEELIEEADKNHDGAIDIDEFQCHLLSKISKESQCQSFNTSFNSDEDSC